MNDEHSPHGADEHESFAGEEIPDPWEDDEQEDWPTEKVEDNA